MVNIDVPRPAAAPTLRGFTLQPVHPAADACWYRGRHAASDTATLLRRIDGIAFADAVRDLASVLPFLDSVPAGVAPPLAVIIVARGTTVGGTVATGGRLTIEPDPAAAAALVPDSPVDVWTVYEDAGVEVLADAAIDPRRACEHLVAVAEVLDRLDGGHGAIDGTALRVAATGPLVLAVGLAPLDAVRRARLDAMGPWLTVAPERCLPPGLPTSRGDQYALATLWTAARSFRRPPDATSVEDFVRRKLTAPPVLDGLEAAEQAVVARGLHASAEARYDSCTEFAAALLATMPPKPAKNPAQAVNVTQTTRPLTPDTQRISMDGTAPLPAGHDPAMTTAIPDARPAQTVAPAAVSVSITVPPPDKPPAPVLVEPARPEASSMAPPAQRSPPAPPASDTTSNNTSATTTRPVPQIIDADPSSGVLAVAPYKANDLIIPHHRLVRLLGKGGFGEVWQATSPGGFGVAIKVIADLASTEGSKEFRALVTVIRDTRHTNIVPIFGIWFKASDGRLLTEKEAEDVVDSILRRSKTSRKGTGEPLISLELIVAMGLGDQTLYDRLKNRDAEDAQGIDTGQLLEWMRQAASAIDYFNQGHVRDGTTSGAVQHCDIKPQNMLLVGNMVWVCDFGLARAQGEAKATANNLLSVAYAAPETMVRPFQPSSTTDQYGLAVSYYELRTGRLPYGDPEASSTGDLSAVELMRAKTDGTTDVSLVPPAEQRVMRRALSLEPADRYGSCAEFVDQLRIAVESDSAPPPEPVRTPWRKAAAVTTIGLFSIASLAGALAWLRPTVPADPARPEPVPPVSQASEPEPVPPVSQASEPEPVPPVEDARDNQRRLLADAWQQLDASVAEDASIDLDAVNAVLAAAEQLDRVDEKERDRLMRTAKTIKDADARLVTLASTTPQPDNAALDDAVTFVDRAAQLLPEQSRTRLERRLSSLIVAHIRQRLEAAGLVTCDSSPDDKRQAVDAAIRDLKKAIQFDDRSWMALNELGFCTYLLAKLSNGQKRYTEAVAVFDKAIELLDENGGEGSARSLILARRRCAHAKAGNFAAAAADDEATLAGQPRTLWDRLSLLSDEAWNQQSWDQCVTILDAMDKLQGTSMGDWRPAAGFRPEPTEVHRLGDVLANRGWLLACGRGTAPEARAVAAATEHLTYVEKQEDWKKWYLNALDTLACAHARAGDFKAAVECIERAIQKLDEPGFKTDQEFDFAEKRALFRDEKPWDHVVPPGEKAP